MFRSISRIGTASIWCTGTTANPHVTRTVAGPHLRTSGGVSVVERLPIQCVKAVSESVSGCCYDTISLADMVRDPLMVAKPGMPPDKPNEPPSVSSYCFVTVPVTVCVICLLIAIASEPVASLQFMYCCAQTLQFLWSVNGVVVRVPNVGSPLGASVILEAVRETWSVSFFR